MNYKRQNTPNKVNWNRKIVEIISEKVVETNAHSLIENVLKIPQFVEVEEVLTNFRDKKFLST